VCSFCCEPAFALQRTSDTKLCGGHQEDRFETLQLAIILKAPASSKRRGAMSFQEITAPILNVAIASLAESGLMDGIKQV